MESDERWGESPGRPIRFEVVSAFQALSARGAILTGGSRTPAGVVSGLSGLVCSRRRATRWFAHIGRGCVGLSGLVCSRHQVPNVVLLLAEDGFADHRPHGLVFSVERLVKPFVVHQDFAFCVEQTKPRERQNAVIDDHGCRL